MRTLLLLPVLALAGICDPTLLHAQAASDTTRRAPSTPELTAQDISDACQHKPGARLRLYGCRREAYLPTLGEPLFIIDGDALPTDTVGPRRAIRETTLHALRAEDIEEITPVRPDSAALRFGSAARFGAVLIRTRKPNGGRVK